MADLKKQQKRLKMARQQLKLADIARREAMAALADAVSNETRSAALADRSRDLIRDYAERDQAQTGQSLRANARFVQRLADIADQADRARKDASDQAVWQVQTLASAETRANRFEERMRDARRDIEAVVERRENADQASMARKLQSKRHEPRWSDKVRK